MAGTSIKEDMQAIDQWLQTQICTEGTQGLLTQERLEQLQEEAKVKYRAAFAKYLDDGGSVYPTAQTILGWHG